ncbi:MAG: hypothetical protein H7A33_04935 [Deltaproteobacteria bacterium]|nr:hypothetical protein [Deltaproteobacteria bacterium]
MKKLFLTLGMTTLLFGLTQCQGDASKTSSTQVQGDQSKREYLLEKFNNGKVAVVRSYLDGFENLSKNDKLKLYYLSRAAIAGRDIHYDQVHENGLKLRGFFEDLVFNKKLNGDLANQAEDFLKIIWAYNGQYHGKTGHKIVPSFDWAELQNALPKENLEWLKPLFDKSVEPILTNLTPKGAEGDIIQASATNIYDNGLSLEDIKGVASDYAGKLNVRFAKTAQGIEPQVYKIGGVYGDQLKNVAYFLKKAAELSDGDQKAGLEELVNYYESGDEETFRKASIAWLKSEPKVDTINGFIESYMDPRQVVGSWEGVAYYTNTDPVLEKVSENVAYFEKGMPWSEEYKRTNFESKPVATLINVAMMAGESAASSVIGINLPNYQDIRSKFGSKNVILTNLMEAYTQSSGGKYISNFILPENQDVVEKYSRKTDDFLTFLHEVIGHGSGKAADSLKGDPRDHIGPNYGAWEEARASLVAYHYLLDDKFSEWGYYPKKDKDEFAKAFLVDTFTSPLYGLRRAEHETILREAHDRARLLISEYVRQNSDGCYEVVNTEGNYFVKMNDVNKCIKAASDLLKIVHEAKATGDRKTVDAYMEKYGTHINTQWRDNVVARVNKLKLPEAKTLVFPKLVPVIENGQVADIKVDNSESFFEQQKRFGQISKSTEVSDVIF